ncbi:Hypothetical predicted protein [Paramuricea clavata]|uniref:Uncharacterized protein n=1 Tax=Paramuricea clavata TaxID=317549 RepID=A0A6S7I6G2_PARCT|nr:Hypothetical predicted protein [Paramuricea clavata]
MDQVPPEIPTCEELIQRYFKRGFNYQKILSFLSKYHEIEMSLRTLHTKLRDLGLKRKNIIYNIDHVRRRIQQELDGLGCFGGYRAVWHTLKMEAITEQHFLNAVREYGGCPTILRTDNGTENVIMAAMQSYFRCNGDDEYAGEIAHRYGTSPSNQRIECWWSYLRKNRSNWWINFLKDLVEAEDLSSVQLHWNSHYIRKSRFDTISGRPDELYFLPDCSGGRNYIKSVTDEQFDDMSQYCHEYNEDNLYKEYFGEIFEQLHLGEPTNWRECLDLYNRLCEIAEG